MGASESTSLRQGVTPRWLPWPGDPGTETYASAFYMLDQVVGAPRCACVGVLWLTRYKGGELPSATQWLRMRKQSGTRAVVDGQHIHFTTE